MWSRPPEGFFAAASARGAASGRGAAALARGAASLFSDPFAWDLGYGPGVDEDLGSRWPVGTWGRADASPGACAELEALTHGRIAVTESGLGDNVYCFHLGSPAHCGRGSFEKRAVIPDLVQRLLRQPEGSGRSATRPRAPPQLGSPPWLQERAAAGA